MSTTLQITDLPENVAAILDGRAAEAGVTVSEYVCGVLAEHTSQQTATEAVAELVQTSTSAGFPVSADEAWAAIRDTRV